MAVEITPERVAAAAARLSDGGWRFTSRQLYYAVCRDVETPPTRVAPGELSLGVLLVLVGAITGNRVILAALGALGIVLLLVGIVTHRAERRPLPDARLLVVSFDSFCRDHLDGHAFPGMLGGTDPATTGTDDAAVVLLCDRTDTAAMVRANASHLGVDVDVVAADALHAVGAGASVVAVHDVSPAGCAIAADARDRGLTVTDAGLNPRDVIGHRVQLIEGAPACLPRDLSASLDATELDWLTRGRRVELATLTPEEVVLRLGAAIRGSDIDPSPGAVGGDGGGISR